MFVSILLFILAALPPLFMADQQTVWRVENGEAQAVFSLLSQTASLEALSPNEQAALEDLNMPFEPTLLTQRIAGIWTMPGEKLLVQVDKAVCNLHVTGSRACAGFAEIYLVTPDHASRLLLSLDYHYRPALEQWACLSGRDAQITDIAVNPVKAQLVILLRKPSFHCDLSNSWGLLVDYSGATVTLEDIPFSYHFTWSADGERLAYLDRGGCLHDPEPFACRDNRILIRTGNMLEEVTPMTLHPDHSLSKTTALVWLDHETLVYAITTYDWQSMEDYRELGTYNIATAAHAVYESQPWEITQLYRTADYLVAVSKDYGISANVTYLFDPQPPFIHQATLEHYLASWYTENGSLYTVLVAGMDGMREREVMIIGTGLATFQLTFPIEGLEDKLIWWIKPVWF